MDDSNGPKVAQWMAAETLAEHLEPLLEHYDVKNRNHGIIYVDHQPDNIETAQRILTDLSVHFGVSTHLIRAKLIGFDLLNDVRSSLPTPNEAVRVAVLARAWATAQEDACDMNEEHDED
ncbi:hypothetical protein D3C84_987820 [compost metagenome]